MPTLTATQRREAARTAYEEYLAACPSRQLFARLSDKWTGPIMLELAEGPRRYGELTRTIAGASQKMLTQTLRTLERDGYVARTVTAEVPTRVDYELTPLGRGMLPIIWAIKDFADTHIDRIHAARASYDAETGQA